MQWDARELAYSELFTEIALITGTCTLYVSLSCIFHGRVVVAGSLRIVCGWDCCNSIRCPGAVSLPRGRSNNISLLAS